MTTDKQDPTLPEPFGELDYQRPSGMWGRLEGYTAEQMKAYGQASREQALEDVTQELSGMTCNNATARSAIKVCIETITEMK